MRSVSILRQPPLQNAAYRSQRVKWTAENIAFNFKEWKGYGRDFESSGYCSVQLRAALGSVIVGALTRSAICVSCTYHVLSHGKAMTRAIDAARERMAAILFTKWSKRDPQDLARLMRRFADDLQALPTPQTMLVRPKAVS